ncbi:MAG: phosphoglucosamine mutase [Bacteroidales bacterium]|nr:phosphoglucosamine mutase [Bacteroidales bacterium]
MTLIKSISGIRGTIGGNSNDNLTPLNIVKFVSAFSCWCKENTQRKNPRIVVGRDSRISGEMIYNIVKGTLMACGCNVIDIGMATTPTTEIAVPAENADGGIIITASHNPVNWNALKLINSNGEFLSEEDGKKVLQLSENDFIYNDTFNLGKVIYKDYLNYHIEKILSLRYVNINKIKEKKYKVIVDGINSIGVVAVAQLLEKLGINDYYIINAEISGNFAHNPEPLDENLSEIKDKVKKENADLGIVVDPDVDRLCLVCEDGTLFGEEYTLVAIADYILSKVPPEKRKTVSNMSSSIALKYVTEKKHYGTHYLSAVGEVNVVKKMKEVNAIIGGEGNGGIILPELHYGRDALVGIALFLSYLSELNIKPSELKQTYPLYYLIKDKIENVKIDIINFIDILKNNIKEPFTINTEDGLRIDFIDETWLHVRKSNTENIIRIYCESAIKERALSLVRAIKELIYKSL